jgi:haloalkane dehalogenase
MEESEQRSVISAGDPFVRRRKSILDSEMAYIDEGGGDPIIFLHGNPTSSYLWRNVIPHLSDLSRCLAPDLIGMGESGKSTSGSYRFVDHARYLDAWIEALSLDRKITLVVHDWGSALGFHWAFRHQARVRSIIYMEALVAPITWENWPEESRSIFKAIRSPRGDRLILQGNLFVERVLPASVERGLTDQEMDNYRRPYLEPGESRRPTLTWPREIPIEGNPADVHKIVSEYAEWLPTSPIPKLFVNVIPGFFSSRMRDYCRTWENQEEVNVPGHHFVQEDSPHELGEAIADFIKDLEG